MSGQCVLACPVIYNRLMTSEKQQSSTTNSRGSASTLLHCSRPDSLQMAASGNKTMHSFGRERNQMNQDCMAWVLQWETLCCLLLSFHLVAQPASSLFTFWSPQAQWTSWASTLPLWAHWLRIRMHSMRSLNPPSEKFLPQNTCTCWGNLMPRYELIMPPGPAALETFMWTT